MPSNRRPILALALALLAAAPAGAGIIYVRPGAAGNGASWAGAYGSVQTALLAANSGDEIWVAAGTYHPAPPPSSPAQGRQESFALKNGVALYGGFAGTETTRGQR